MRTKAFRNPAEIFGGDRNLVRPLNIYFKCEVSITNMMLVSMTKWKLGDFDQKVTVTFWDPAMRKRGCSLILFIKAKKRDWFGTSSEGGAVEIY